METDLLIRGWIADVLLAHSALVGIAVRQRAKFEGWLKFELAAFAEAKGMQDVRVEPSTGELTRSRSDLTFSRSGERYDIELKTCNTNYRMEGVLELTRPITKNLAAIIDDAKKLQVCAGRGIVAVCIFPVCPGDRRWIGYLERISEGTGIGLSADHNSTRVTIPLRNACAADVVVVSFPVADSRPRGS